MTFPSSSNAHIISINDSLDKLTTCLAKSSQPNDIEIADRLLFITTTLRRLDEDLTLPSLKLDLNDIKSPLPKTLHNPQVGNISAALDRLQNHFKNILPPVRYNSLLTTFDYMREELRDIDLLISNNESEIEALYMQKANLELQIKNPYPPLPKVLTDPPAPPSNNKIITKCIFMALVYFLPMITVLVYTEQYVWAAIFWFITIAVSTHNIQVEIEERDSK